ncbi:MAG: YeeE/YedE family protein [Hyphomicrobium sp.]|nr:YeeE/YedE family protein [Hyphomicrobium sp.]
MRDAIAQSPALTLAVGGFLIGLAFGILARSANYCVMGAISDWRLFGDITRLGATALAAAVAIIGAQGLNAAGVVDLTHSIYLSPRINWLGSLIGGGIFGAGMIYAGGCPSRALIRAGGGDLRAWVSLVTMAFAATVTLSGILGEARVSLEQATAFDVRTLGLRSQAITDVVSAVSADAGWAVWAASAIVALPLLIFAFFAAGVASRPWLVAAGISVGLLVTAGWALSGLAADEMALSPVSPLSLSFVKPVADAVDWVQRSTALGLPGFGAASVFGVVTGGAIAAWSSGEWRLAGFGDAPDFYRHLGGALAMGVGGVLGLGCTIGQGATGLSTLAVQSILTCSAIIAGAVLALRYLQRAV